VLFANGESAGEKTKVGKSKPPRAGAGRTARGFSTDRARKNRLAAKGAADEKQR
jgi:hypothetical protein